MFVLSGVVRSCVFVLRINPPPASCASATMLSLDAAWRIFKLFVVVGVPANALLVLIRLILCGQRRRRCPSAIRSRTPSACRVVSAGDDEGSLGLCNTKDRLDPRDYGNGKVDVDGKPCYIIMAIVVAERVCSRRRSRSVVPDQSSVCCSG